VLKTLDLEMASSPASASAIKPSRPMRCCVRQCWAAWNSSKVSHAFLWALTGPKQQQLQPRAVADRPARVAFGRCAAVAGRNKAR